MALLDRTDRWHDACSSAFLQIRLPLLTSEAVLTDGVPFGPGSDQSRDREDSPPFVNVFSDFFKVFWEWIIWIYR
jgi:hypothetical protein